MRIRLTVPGEPNAETLGIALDAATLLAQHDIRSGRIPPIEDAIQQGIEWQPEPPGDESFDKPSTVLERGWGDCDDLAPWLAAEMRETGFDGGASAIAIPSGRNTWHAIVRGSDGDIYDPSKWAGMPHDVVGACAACSQPLNVGKPAIAMGRRGVRVDMPGLQTRRGCLIGVSHERDCASSDEDRVRALVQTIEDAIVTAQLARTGDKRAIKQLAVIYRVLRGDDPATACAGMQIRPDQVGIDFDSASVRNFIRRAREVLAAAGDELFNGETWTTENNGRVVKARKVAMSGHRMGFLPCLAPLGYLATAAASAGTIAAVLDPIAAALRELAGKDSDFGRAMATLREGLSGVKLASSLGAGAIALAAEGIPQAFQATTMRWFELLREPGSQTAKVDATKLQDVAKTLAWTERAIATQMPSIATTLTPALMDLLKGAKYEDAVKLLRTEMLKRVGPQFAEAQAVAILKALVEHPESMDLGGTLNEPIRKPEYEPGTSPEDIAAQEAADTAAFEEAAKGGALQKAFDTYVDELRDDADDARENLRTVPIIVRVPTGWDPIFGMGCRQLTDQCP